MIGLICGDVGTGKTALMVLHMINQMVGESAQRRLEASRNMVLELDRGGYNFTLPCHHVVFSNIPVFAPVGFRRFLPSWVMDGFEFGLYDSDYGGTVLEPPYSYLCFDEIQRYYNSRLQNYMFPNFVSRKLETHRHWHIDVLGTCQRASLVDMNFRGLCVKFIFIKRLEHEYDDFRRICKSIWRCVEFSDTDSAEEYCRTKRPPRDFVETTYTYDGNIFGCYDSYGCFPLHLHGREDSDFRFTPASRAVLSLSSVAEYNMRYGGVIPKNFYRRK